MIIKRWFSVTVGFAAGVALGSFFPLAESQAQFGGDSKNFGEKKISPAVPSAYGRLAAVSGTSFYFQAENGSVYIVRQKTGESWDSAVTVIERM